MTSNAESRLDQVERILASVARQQQVTQNQIDALSANQAEERDRRLELREDIELTFQLARQSAENIEALQQSITGLRTENVRIQEQQNQHWNEVLTEIQRIWTYLYDQIRFRGNGNTDNE